MPPGGGRRPHARNTLWGWKVAHGWHPPGSTSRWSNYTLRDVGGAFEAFPNGHRRFLTRGALAKLNLGREDAVQIDEHPLDPLHSQWLTEAQRARQNAPSEERAHAPPLHRWWPVPVPPLVGESLRARRAPARGTYSRAGAPRGARAAPGPVSVAEWVRGGASVERGGAPSGGVDRMPLTHAAGASAGLLFGPYRPRRAPPRGSTVPPPARVDATGERSWDRASTAVPEVPMLMGDTADGTVQTLRLRALGTGDGHTIDLWQGDTIKLRVSGRGPMNGRVVTFVVHDVVYGDKAYINMLVDGGTAMSGGGRSRSARTAFVRVSEHGV